MNQGNMFWGVGIDEDIMASSIEALVSAANKLAASQNVKEGREERIVDIMKYVQNHYYDVTLEDLAESFNLSKPYLSRYIRQKSGMTFQEAVKKARLKRARKMLKESNQTVEPLRKQLDMRRWSIFNRLFKKTYNMTPGQYRSQNR